MDADRLTELRAAFAGRLLTESADTAPYLTDWRRKWTGRASAVVQPDTAADVAAVLRWCREHCVPVVPQGGNTGLSGGSVPDASGDAIVLSLRRLDRVRKVDAVDNTLVVEAGVTLQLAQEAARDVGRLLPLSLAAEGSCTIGGNLATNAGGVHVMRYGNARELCLGLEVVTAEGELWNGLRGLRKDNTGYDLRDVYIGSEGTLGVITAAVLKLQPRPSAQLAAWVGLPSAEAAAALLAAAQSALGPALTAFEVIAEDALALVLRHRPAARRPSSGNAPWHVLLEASGWGDAMRAEAQLQQAVEALLGEAMAQGTADDVVVSTTLAQFESLWRLREDISESQAAEGPSIKHDISLPIGRIAGFVQATGTAVATHFPDVRLIVFGHLGDGNLHYNASPAGRLRTPLDVQKFLALEPALNRLVHDAVAAAGGSISAEHGLGVLRRDEAFGYRPSIESALMRKLKVALDPQGLMNPGKLLR